VKIPYSDDYTEADRHYGTPLNPFLGVENTNILRGIPQGSNPPSQGEYNDDFDSQSVRGMGHRGPLVIVGWGYDLQGRPVPNKLGNMSSINDIGEGSTAYYKHEFKSDFVGPAVYGEKNFAPYGGSVQTRDYKAGTLDVRYDNRRGMWTADHSFLAKLTGAEAFGTGNYVGEKGTSFYKYKWTEVDHYHSQRFIREPDPEFFKPSSSRTSDIQTHAINIAECMTTWATGYLSTSCPAPFYPPLPSGTIVEMKTYFTFNLNGPMPDQPKFIPVCIFDRARTPGQYVMIKSSVQMEINVGVGLKTQVANHWTRYIYTGRIIQWMNPDPEIDHMAQNFSFARGFDTQGYPLSSHEECVTNLENRSPLLGHYDVDMINTVEWTNPDGTDGGGIVNPGIDTCGTDYPEGFAMKPISAGTIVFARPMYGAEFASAEGPHNVYTTFPTASGGAQPAWSFQLVNHHDGIC